MLTSTRLFSFAAIVLVASAATNACMGAWFADGGSVLAGNPALVGAMLGLAAIGVGLAITGVLSESRTVSIAATVTLGCAFALAIAHAWVADGAVTARVFVFLGALVAAIGAVALPFAAASDAVSAPRPARA